ncbi:hypothetical protein ACL2XO_16590 [Sodalis sp. RH15]|uniref:hypothetical protein n=1 Tax=Sodalis sp. RH15 TaxID=3394330 RepID=UPI0039B520DB
MASTQYGKLRRAGVRFFNTYPYTSQVECYVIVGKIEEKICQITEQVSITV